MEIKLYPWDAGTDDGVTYMVGRSDRIVGSWKARKMKSRQDRRAVALLVNHALSIPSLQASNLKSDPQQKIHRITNTFPDNPASPFWGSEEIKPLALLQLRRIHPKPGAMPTCTGNDEEEALDEAEGFGSTDGEGELTEMEKKKLMMMKGKVGQTVESDMLIQGHSLKWSQVRGHVP